MTCNHDWMKAAFGPAVCRRCGVMAHKTPEIQKQAEEWAAKNGCTGPVGFVNDRWGGYWQSAGPHGPYNFRLPTNVMSGFDPTRWRSDEAET